MILHCKFNGKCASEFRKSISVHIGIIPVLNLAKSWHATITTALNCLMKVGNVAAYFVLDITQRDFRS